MIKDGKTYRMYYRGGTRPADGLFKSGSEITCYAESNDGITWVKPKLGIVPFDGGTQNNIILAPDRRGFSHNFTAMLDWARDSRSDQQFGDIRNLISAGCDAAYIEYWTEALGLTSLWQELQS